MKSEIYKMLKKLTAVFLLITLSFSLFACSKKQESEITETEPETEISEYNPTVEEENTFEKDFAEDIDLETAIWNHLISQYHNPVAAAAIMSNIYCESSMIPYRIENDTDPGEDGDYPLSKLYAQHIDDGDISRDTFCQSGYSGGAFGLFAWTDQGRKEGLYDFAKDRGVSISDWEMQLDYAYEEIIERYYNLYRILLSSDDLYACCDYFMGVFEKASSNDSNGPTNKRWWYAREYYEKFAGEDYVFSSPFEEYDLFPINGTYDYLDYISVGPDNNESNIYAYLAQRGLIRLGYIPDDSATAGFFGKGTEEAVLKLQRDFGLEETGVVGPDEWIALSQENLNRNVDEIWTYPES